VGRMFGAQEKALLRAAAAVECVHAYSLIHDDLPCMDDDDFRRGQPTVHKAFDEATAVLAGDALLALAFEIMASPETHRDAVMRCRLVERMAIAAGPRGMVAGQMIDMKPDTDMEEPLQVLTRMQRLKTGALISFAGEVGALLGGALDHERQAIAGYTNDLGLAFQIVDDLLDVEGEAEEVGKATAKDAAAGKVNFVSLLGVDGAKERVRYLAAQAKQHLAPFGGRATTLLHTVDFVLYRRH
jgi:farnesyl diphosphate synthase